MASLEVIEALLQKSDNLRDKLSADSLNQTEKAALNVFIIVPQQFINILIKILFNSYYKPLDVHFEQKKICQYCFTSQHN